MDEIIKEGPLAGCKVTPHGDGMGRTIEPRKPPYPFCRHEAKCIEAGRCMSEICCAD